MDWLFIPTKKQEHKGLPAGAGIAWAFRDSADNYQILGYKERIEWFSSLGIEDKVFTYGGGWGLQALIRGALLTKNGKGSPTICTCNMRWIKALLDERNRKQGSIGDMLSGVAGIIRDNPQAFYEVHPTEYDLIYLRELVGIMEETMRARIALGNQIRSRMAVIHSIPTTEKILGSWVVRQEMAKLDAKTQESEVEKDIIQFVKQSPYLSGLFGRLMTRGVSYKLVARILAKLLTVRRFPEFKNIKAYSGVYPRNGKLPRLAQGGMQSHDPQLQSSLFQVAEQIVKQDKGMFRAAYDYKKTRLNGVCCKDSNKHSAKNHCHKIAMWYAASKWLFHLWKTWRDYNAEMDKLGVARSEDCCVVSVSV